MLSMLVGVAAACVACGREGAATVSSVAYANHSLSSPANARIRPSDFTGLEQAPRARGRVDSQRPARDTVPPAPPDSLPFGFYDDSNFVIVPALSSIPVRRDAVAVFFKRGVSQAQKAAAIEGVADVVVGGGRSDGTVEGDYVVLLPRDSTHRNIFDTISKLAADPSIAIAMAIQVLRIATEPTVPALRPSGSLCATCIAETPGARGTASAGTSSPSRPVASPRAASPCNLSIVGRQIPNCVLITFRADATTAQRVASVAAVNGTIDKNDSLEDPHGIWFLVGVPDDSTWATVDSALVRLRRMPGVRNADRYFAFQLGSGESASSIESPLKLVPCARCESDARLLLQDVPVPAPDSVPIAVLKAFRADSNITHDDAPEQAGYFPRNIVLVRFLPSATRTQRNALLRSVRGKVLGGFPIGIGGMYYVQVEGARTTEHLFRAIALLKASPLVKLAIVDALDEIQPVPARE